MTQTVATLVHSGTLGAMKGLIPWQSPQWEQDHQGVPWQHCQALPSLCGTCRGLWTSKGLGPTGLVTLFLQGMGPPLTNELSYNGKKAEASEGAQRPHTARPSRAPRGPERERSHCHLEKKASAVEDQNKSQGGDTTSTEELQLSSI